MWGEHMGIFDFFRQPDIDQGVQTYHQTPGAVLLDVRTPEEYRQGHTPGSRNLSLQAIGALPGMIENRETPLFVYCQSGARSSQAVSLLRQMGYTNVQNIGGIASYTGKVER